MLFNAGLLFSALLLALEYGGAWAAPNAQNRDTHNIYECEYPARSKYLLYSHVVNEPAKFLQIIEKTIYYPETAVNNARRISCIVITDTSPDGTGGYPSVISGGVGSYFTEILLRSQFSRGLYYKIEVYADNI